MAITFYSQQFNKVLAAHVFIIINILGSSVYQIGIKLLQIVLPILSLFNDKIKKGVEGRAGLRTNLVDFRERLGGRRLVWFHAASLGEFEQGRPVMEAFRRAYPDFAIVLTFFSPSGYEVRKNYTGADFICYLPIDTPSNAKWFVQTLKPEFAFFIKYEFWFNYLCELKRAGCTILSFSTLFRRNQLFFKSYGGFYRNMLGYFNHLFVQNETSVALLNGIGVFNCSVSGDTRFDRVASIAGSSREISELIGFKTGVPCMVAGSVWPQDMEVVVPILNTFRGRLKAIIAPHEIVNEQIENWMHRLNGTSVMFSEIQNADLRSIDYLFIDNIGMLSSLYQYGDLAFIGGGFGSGLHNVLEASTFGLPVIFGNKNFSRFREAKDLVELGGGFAVSGYDDTSALIGEWLADSQAMLKAGVAGQRYVHDNTGATNAVMEHLKRIISK